MTQASCFDLSTPSATSTDCELAFPVDHAVDLSEENTMALACVADTVITLTDETQLDDFMRSCIRSQANKLPLLVLSGGSNVLLPAALNAVVLLPKMRGIHVTAQTDGFVDIEVMAGESWHDLVVHTVNQGWYGLENLALIPGLTGRARLASFRCSA